MQAHTFTILLVEDYQDLRIAIRTRLRIAGYEVLEAADGQQGAELAQAKMPDLIFMDLDLPILNGFDAIKQIRTDERCSNIPIIAISNHCWDFNWKVRAMSLGCAECVDKGNLMSAFDDLLQRYAN